MLDWIEMGDAIWNRIKGEQTYSPGILPAYDTYGRNIWRVISDEIIKHFILRAEIRITSFTATAPGVTPGPGVSGNITGIADGIILE